MKLTENQLRDYRKYYVDAPDSDFSPERNAYIVEKTIKETDNAIKQRKKEYAQKVAERSEAVASYIKYLDKGGGSAAEKYFGRRNLAHLRGQKILQTIRNNEIIIEEID
jgi:hypothetical protein